MSSRWRRRSSQLGAGSKATTVLRPSNDGQPWPRVLEQVDIQCGCTAKIDGPSEEVGSFSLSLSQMRSLTLQRARQVRLRWALNGLRDFKEEILASERQASWFWAARLSWKCWSTQVGFSSINCLCSMLVKRWVVFSL